jgi:hypothetical protein
MPVKKYQLGVPFDTKICCLCLGYIGMNADGATKYVLALTEQSAVVHYSSVRTAKTARDAMLPFGSLSVFISFDIAGN